MKSKVAVVKCNSYKYKKLKDKIKESLNLIGGLKKIVKPKENVLLKVNILSPRKIEDAVCTNPNIVKAVAELVLEEGAVPTIGDIPGYVHHGKAKELLDITGMNKIADELNIKALTLESEGFIKKDIPNGVKIKKIFIPKKMKEYDKVINIPKLKTHMQTLFTGAVKNMFGLVPWGTRRECHALGRYKDFSESLVDIYIATKPDLNIMDGIVGMEGNGPARGKAKNLGVIISSDDGVALDAVCSKIIDIEPFKVYTTYAAHKREVGCGDLKEIEILGEEIENVVKKISLPPTFIFNINLLSVPPPLAKAFEDLTRVRPYINKEKCVKCETCVKACPVNAIKLDGKPQINMNICLNCFCCHELCPEGAVEIRRNFLARILRRLEI